MTSIKPIIHQNPSTTSPIYIKLSTIKRSVLRSSQVKWHISHKNQLSKQSSKKSNHTTKINHWSENTMRTPLTIPKQTQIPYPPSHLKKKQKLISSPKQWISRQTTAESTKKDQSKQVQKQRIFQLEFEKYNTISNN